MRKDIDFTCKDCKAKITTQIKDSSDLSYSCRKVYCKCGRGYSIVINPASNPRISISPLRHFEIDWQTKGDYLPKNLSFSEDDLISINKTESLPTFLEKKLGAKVNTLGENR